MDYANMPDETQERLMELVNELVTITKDCRNDMHEPDEQDVHGRVVGRFGLDNAVGLDKSNVGTERENETDLHLILEDYDKGVLGVFNLADMIAAMRLMHARLNLKVGQLRVWHVINPPRSPYRQFVDTPDAAVKLINERAQADLANPRVHDNAFGLEVWDGLEWSEWYSEDGLDIREYEDSLEGQS